MDDLQLEYRQVAERRQRQCPDPLGSLIAYVLSSACVVLLAATPLMSARRH
ncbi:hypothetical protein [Kitasatospora cystarginea]|uniref:hypothetical protein n=1 Tax=Kitasatospora cystarginea TaxID=58350 RepID=UPI0031E0FEE4